MLRYRGEGAKPDADVERVRRLPEATVVDDSSSRMVLVESPEEPLRELVASLSEWVVAPDQGIPLPDTRKRIKGSD